MTEWPVTIDRRYHDAVILDLDSVVTTTEPTGARTLDSSVPLLRRLRDGGVATALYSSTPGEADLSVLTETTTRLGVSPGRCVIIAHDQAGVQAGRDGGFSLVIGLDRNRTDELLSCGADTVIADLAEISVRSGDAAMSTIADALQAYSQLKELVTSRRPAVFLDFDGTLSDIVEDPESATLVDGAADALRALAAQCPVAVISGRDLADVRKRVKVDGVWYAGNHGFELVAPDGTHHENAAAASAIDTLAHAATQLAETLSDIPGIVVEHKRFAVAIHYRNADPETADRVIATVRRLGRAEHLRVTQDRKVIEVRPNIAWDKGRTPDWLLEHIAEGDSTADSDTMLPIYIGDDITDEDAFDAMQFDGVGIVVRHDDGGDRPSAARFSLESPSAVSEFIQRLAGDIENEATRPADTWELVFEGYDQREERLREALCTVGNGYVATRGCAPEAPACEAHYPGTYATGVYNTLADRIAGRTIDNESLVNLPNWLSLTFRIDGGPWFSVDDAELLL